MSVSTMFAKLQCVMVAVLLWPVPVFGSCKTDSLNMARSLFHGRRLRSHAIDSQPVSMPIMCHMKCLDNCGCLSYNVCNGGTLCELNSEKNDNNISVLERSDECDYHEFTFTRQQSSGCRDQCCSTSEPCLHGARCQASCMENGRRFQCICGDGQKGYRCENVARNCAFYANSGIAPQSQVRVLYTPDNTTYKTFCHVDSWYKYTLAFSYSVENFAVFYKQPLSVDYPVLEDSFNWQKFRLGLARMQGLRQGAKAWRISCLYDEQGRNDTDKLVVLTSTLDPLRSYQEILCPKVKQVRINDQGCDKCVVGMAHWGNTWNLKYEYAKDCSSAVQVLPQLSCS